MNKKFGKIFLIVVFIIASVVPLLAQEWIDATHLFADETKWLADNVQKETKAEYQLRTKGVVQMADVKPPRVGDVENFNTFNVDTMKHEKTSGVLKKIGKHCYIYLQKGKSLSDQVIANIAQTFDERIYPTDTAFFGNEWTPGIDNDSRITLFLLDIRDNFQPNGPNKMFTSGYFYSGDEYSLEKNPSSNEREMLYLDIYPTVPGSDNFMSVIAHEFEHMIQWHHDPKEVSWVNESCAQLASYLSGFGHPPQIMVFAKQSDNNLCGWRNDNMVANYGQVYLFAYYLYKHSGTTDKQRNAFLRAIIDEKATGSEGISKVLKKCGLNDTFSQIFRDFCVTNFLNRRDIGNGRFGYDQGLAKFRLGATTTISQIPSADKGRVKCWSAKAVRVDISGLEGELKISFQGEKKAHDQYSNVFDVAAVFMDGKGKALPTVEWILSSNFRAEKVLKTRAGLHDTLLLIVCNRGPEGGEIENTYSQRTGSAEFSYAVSGSAKGTAKKIAAVKNRGVSRRTMNSMATKIADRQPISAMVNQLAEDEKIDSSVSTIYINDELDRQVDEENLIVDSIKASIQKGQPEMLSDFFQLYNQASAEGKENLSPIRSRIIEIIRFEIAQNNRTDLSDYLQQ